MAESGQRISEYILDRRVGAGAFGEVWRAIHHIWGDQVVAIKLPTDVEYLRSIQREGVNIRGLLHPNIVKAIGFDPYADPPYLVMEYVSGESLRQWIMRGPIPPTDVQAIMQQILAGLSYAHKAGIVHRDLKPENIMIDDRAKLKHSSGGFAEGLVKITDFGLGKRVSIDPNSIQFSMSIQSPGAITGTLNYMSPEQRAGNDVDARADLYSLGVIFFEMLTGERPSGTESPGELQKGVPSWMDVVFRKAYTRLDRRFISADELIKAFVPGPPELPENIPASPPAIVSSAIPLAKLSPSIHRDCPRCRRETIVGDQFCMHCGVQLVEYIRRCKKCGGYPSQEDRFCIYCGTEINQLRLSKSS